MSAPKWIVTRGAEESQARALKAERLVDALTDCGLRRVDAETVERMDAGWVALEALAGTRPASTATRRLVVDRLRLRARLAGSDPFDVASSG